jgi:hypothetical protein
VVVLVLNCLLPQTTPITIHPSPPPHTCIPTPTPPQFPKKYKQFKVAFFKTIRAEIAKATEFYLGMEQEMGARKRRIQ